MGLSMTDDILIVLVNWNLKDDTLDCIDSLLNAGIQPGQIIVVDQGSTDGSVEGFKARFNSSIHIIENNQNLGYADGVNHGAVHALEMGAEWVMVMNNDTIVSPDLFEKLTLTAQQYPQYSILAPLILYHEDPERIWFFGDRLIPGTLATYSLYKEDLATEKLPKISSVDFISGCGMMIRSDIFREVGYFDTSFFMYGEEVDFCQRVRQAGFKLASVSGAKMWHKVSLSSKRDRPKSRYYQIRNQIWFYRKHASIPQKPLMFIFSLIRSSWIGVKDLYYLRSKLISPLLKGWFEGWFYEMD
jgi:GT2 family glycosyltransferase